MDRRTLQRARRRQARRHRRRWPRRLLVAFLVLVVLAVAAGAGTWYYARYRFDQIKKIHAKHLDAQPAPGQPFDVLLVGSDSRTFVKTTPKKEQEFETPTSPTTNVGGQRSDVTMVARFIPATKQVWILSIPRDLWVDIPGHGPQAGPNRINAAFNTGPDLLIQTIEQVLGIPINHYISVTFTGFQAMVNALGGVTMDFPDPVKDAYSGLDVTQTGCQLVDGATALELVRARHLYYEATGTWNYDGLSDFSRIQRQDAFFRAVLTKLNRVKLDPLTLNSFLGAAVKDLTIDTTLTESDLFSMAEQFHGLSQGSLHTETLPTYGFTTTGGADVLGEAVPGAAQAIAAFDHLGETATTPTTARAPGTTTSTTAPPLTPAQVPVQVLNGVDFTAPVASETAASLEQQGFPVTLVANAPSEGVATTEIQYADGHEAAGQAVATHLSGATTLVADPQLSGDHVVLTVGRSFTGVTAGNGGSSGSTGSGTTTASGAATGSATTTTGAATGSTGTTTSGSTPTGAATGPAAATTGTATGGSTTTTTPPSEVYTNTQPEPWNPTPCVQ